MTSQRPFGERNRRWKVRIATSKVAIQDVAETESPGIPDDPENDSEEWRRGLRGAKLLDNIPEDVERQPLDEHMRYEETRDRLFQDIGLQEPPTFL